MAIKSYVSFEIGIFGDGVSTTATFNLFRSPFTFTAPGGAVPKVMEEPTGINVQSGATSAVIGQFGDITFTWASAPVSFGTVTGLLEF